MKNIFNLLGILFCSSIPMILCGQEVNQTEPDEIIVYACGSSSTPNITLAALGGFADITPNGDGTVTQCFDLLNDLGIDPATISNNIPISLYYDQGFNSVEFTTSNGASEIGATNPSVGITGDHFAYATLPNDGSSQICATVDATASGISEISLFATIEHGDFDGGVTGTSFIDNEIFVGDTGGVGECEEGILPINSNGENGELMDINVRFSMSEVELGDPRMIDVRFEACGVIYEASLDPEPAPGVPGVAILNLSLTDVPADCQELQYLLCSNQGGQSFGVGGIAAYYDCFCRVDGMALDAIICEGNDLSLTASSPYNNISSWQWTGPAGFTSNQQNPSLMQATVNASGEYVVTLTDLTNCSITDTVMVEVENCCPPIFCLPINIVPNE